MTEIFDVPQSEAHLRIVAHRGTTVFAPENTIASFLYAGKRGAWAIETDLRMTRDGVIVCIHDETVDRCYNGSGRVAEHTFAELRALTANHEAFAGLYASNQLRIPTFDEYLDICDTYRAIPFIEIKDEVIPAVVEKLQARGMIRRAVISSSMLCHLVETRTYSADIFVHHIFSDMESAKTMASLGSAGVAFNYPDLHLLPTGFVETIHGMGLKLCLRAGDTAETVKKMLALGLDYIPSNQIFAIEGKAVNSYE